MSKLAGKVALVTGGSRGIGAAIANRLADDGAALAITYSARECRAGHALTLPKENRMVQRRTQDATLRPSPTADPAAVINRERSSWGNHAPVVKPEDVTARRQ